MREYSNKLSRAKMEIRTDAEANRKSLVFAARRLFARHGPEVSLAEIAKSAKISRATLYRNFKDKGALVAAVFEYNIDLLEQYALKLSHRDDAFFKILEMIAYQQAKFQSLIFFFQDDEKLLIQRLVKILEEPVNRAKATRSLRKDYDIKRDLFLMVSMLAVSLTTFEGQARKDQAKRALQLLLEGIKDKA